jgi:hypothetical protein
MGSLGSELSDMDLETKTLKHSFETGLESKKGL